MRSVIPLTLAASTAACFSPTYDRCTVLCADQGCPSGLECRTDNFCHASGAPADEICSILDGPSLDSPAPFDAPIGSLDAPPPPPDAPPPPPDAPCGRIEAWTEADGILNAGTGSEQPKGGLPVANVSAGLPSVGLFRFNIGAAPPGTITGGRMVFTYAALSPSCASGTCPSCDGVDNPGTLAVFFMRSDWVEASFTYQLRSSGLYWAAAGASAPGVDRGAGPIATAVHPDNSSQTIEIPAAGFNELGLWLSGGKISFQLVPTNGVAFVIATKENSSIEHCGTYPAALLQIDYCLY